MRNYVIDELGHERIFFSLEDWWVADIDSYYSGEWELILSRPIEDCELLEISKENFQLLEKNTKAQSMVRSEDDPQGNNSQQEI